MSRISWLIVMLSVAAGAQLTLFLVQWRTKPATLRIGNPIPDLQVTKVDSGSRLALGQLFAGTQDCTWLVVFSVDCGVCKMARPNWAQRFRTWTSSINSNITPIWLSFDDSTSTDQFFRGYDFDTVTLVRASANSASAIGVSATPTGLLLDGDGQLRSMTLGDGFPGSDVVQATCGVER
jgi:hypothetical protein